MVMALTRLGTPFTVTTVLLLVTCLAYVANLVSRDKAVRWVASFLFAVTTGALVWMIVDRYIEAGRPPFKTLYESLILFGACIALVYVLVERFYRLALVGLLATVFILGLFGYAVLKRDVDIISLPAALQSGWFIPHVVVYFLGYGALFVGTVLAAIYLWKPDWKLTFSNLSGERSVGYQELMYTIIKFGFALITFGLVVGAWWAKSAWGDYWVWDPKENWSLITWLVYVVFLHLRRLPGWNDRKSAWVAIVGFAAVMFTYLGMNALPTAEQSAHLYQ
jgi:cytochrome c-type biogenesis protein CcsB